MKKVVITILLLAASFLAFGQTISKEKIKVHHLSPLRPNDTTQFDGGVFKIGNYGLPTTAGLDGQVLKLDNGDAIWSTVSIDTNTFWQQSGSVLIPSGIDTVSIGGTDHVGIFNVDGDSYFNSPTNYEFISGNHHNLNYFTDGFGLYKVADGGLYFNGIYQTYQGDYLASFGYMNDTVTPTGIKSASFGASRYSNDLEVSMGVRNLSNPSKMQLASIDATAFDDLLGFDFIMHNQKSIVHPLGIVDYNYTGRIEFNINTTTFEHRQLATSARLFHIDSSYMYYIMPNNDSIFKVTPSGQFRIGDYGFQTIAGTNGQSLRIDANRNLQWYNTCDSSLLAVLNQSNTFGGTLQTFKSVEIQGSNTTTGRTTTKTLMASDTIIAGTITKGVEIDSTGIFLNGSATMWDDLMFPFTTGSSGGNPYPAFVADSGYYTFTVDTTGPSMAIMYFTIQMPHSWKEGSRIYPHVHYKQVGSNIPQFRVKYRWVNIGAHYTNNWKWHIMNLSTGTTDNTHQMMYNGGIDGTGMTISSILVCKVYLYALASGQTDCKAYQFDIHYEKNSLGSRTQTAK